MQACNIDSIMDMLDWNSPPEVQQRGRELARTIKCFNIFLQPGHPEYNKNVWDNCAIILAEKSDAELKPYLKSLFEWLNDMNWPGAYFIWDRLKCYKDDAWFCCVLTDSINIAKALNENTWLNTLLELDRERQKQLKKTIL